MQPSESRECFNSRSLVHGTWLMERPSYFFDSLSFIFNLSFFNVLKSYQLFCPLFKFLSFSTIVTFFLRSLCFSFIFIYFRTTIPKSFFITTKFIYLNLFDVDNNHLAKNFLYKLKLHLYLCH